MDAKVSTTQGPAVSPGVTGAPRLLLRLEGLVVMAVAALAFLKGGGADALGLDSWLLAIVFFAPDLALLAYLVGPRLGALAYNLVHSYGAPLVL
ncbi:MAG: DUF4260 family protein, partial [Rhodoblastus sp.]